MRSILYTVVNFPTEDQALGIRHRASSMNFTLTFVSLLDFITTLKTPSSFYHFSLLAFSSILNHRPPTPPQWHHLEVLTNV
jgi:hypothetical protein